MALQNRDRLIEELRRMERVMRHTQPNSRLESGARGWKPPDQVK
jgi:hypothetical protein